MTITIQVSKKDAISMPADLAAALDLRDGDKVKAVVEGKTLRLARLDKFLALEGALADDDAFDEAMDYLDRAWEKWTPPVSV
jgi:antitoxin component of MazEF toxin-antitoxin module